MSKIITIRISRYVILKNHEKDTQPMDALAALLKERYPNDLTFLNQIPNELVIRIEKDTPSSQEIGMLATDFLSANYGADGANMNISVKEDTKDGSDLLSRIASISDAGKKNSETMSEEPSVATDETAKDDRTADNSMDRVIEALSELDEELEARKRQENGDESGSETDPDGEAAEEKTMPKKKSKPVFSPEVQEVLDRIHALVGMDEFKALAVELATVAPQMVANKTVEAFTFQSYVFSINDGCGHSAALRLLCALVRALGIKKIHAHNSIHEEKLQLKSNSNPDPFAGVRSILDRGSYDVLQILSIDISEWMNKTDTAEFKSFLHTLSKKTNQFMIVFRVPFVDKEVLAGIYHSLNDLLFVRTVSVPPFSHDEIRRSAMIELEKFGFRMTAAAWQCFDQRITEEKSDGKFYGINTVNKVVWELLYKKQLANGRKGCDSKLIGKQDASSLCAVPDHDARSAWDMLEDLVGADGIREKVLEIVSQIELSKKEGSAKTPCIHMRFVGNPGTGKTTVARIVGKLLKEKGVLRIGNFYEYAGRDFVGRYIGETAPKTASICRDAYGSVLFIDEAYSLYRGPDNEKDFGREALDTLIAEMENHRSDLVVIMAGYTDDMDTLMRGNAGLASRMPYTIEFPNFTREELYRIFVSMVEKDFSYDGELFDVAKEYFLSLPDEWLCSKEFSNARFVRNLFERVWAKAAMRTQLEKGSVITLTAGDFHRSTADKEFHFNMKKKRTIGFMQ